MISYLKSEFYRIFHNKFTYLFIVISSALLVISNIVLAGVKGSDSSFEYANTKFAMSLLIGYFPLLLLLCIMVASMIFGNENSNHTMKNSVSYGISRGTIYFGKLIIEIIYSILAFTIITGIDVASAYLLLDNSGPEMFNAFIKVIFVSVPLFLFSVAITNCFIFIIESTGAATAAIAGLVLVVPLVCQLLGMKFTFFQSLAKVLPWDLINNVSVDDKYNVVLSWSGNAGYYNYWIAGVIQMIMFILIGYIVFRRKEIK